MSVRKFPVLPAWIEMMHNESAYNWRWSSNTPTFEVPAPCPPYDIVCSPMTSSKMYAWLREILKDSRYHWKKLYLDQCAADSV